MSLLGLREIDTKNPRHPDAGVEKLLKAQAPDAQGPGWEQREMSGISEGCYKRRLDFPHGLLL